MKYTKEDVIVCESKAKELGLKVGMMCAFSNAPDVCVTGAKHKVFMSLQGIDFNDNKPFSASDGLTYQCCIIKKEPKYVPYDLSKKEDRDELRGKWIGNKDGEFQILSIFLDEPNATWVCAIIIDRINFVRVPNNALLRDFVFLDTGKPVGKPVEEDKE